MNKRLPLAILTAFVVNCVPAAVCLADDAARASHDTSADPAGWILEFGPYGGYYDFDSLTDFADRGLFGARASVRLNDWALVDAEFDEVYTRRHVTDNRARQVTLAVHGRVEPLRGRVSPALLAGLAFVALDDADDPDAYGEGLDLGLGVRVAATPRWMVRAEWMLRRQRFRLLEEDAEGKLVSSDDVTLWGRSVRLGIAYVF